MISFLLNQQPVHIEQVDPNLTLLDWLREQQNLTGSKEGCASGDCGACTVTVAEINGTGEGLSYKSINSCITFLSALDGKQLITVEHLEHKGQLHPVQQAMVEQHGSQCGFCTPGFVMSMFTLYQQRLQQDKQLDREGVNVALSGNLCRCTGYRPIIDATLAACQQPQPDQFSQQKTTTVSQLKGFNQDNVGVDGLHIPRSRAQLAALLKQYPGARLLAGSTDLALEVTQQLKQIEHLVSLGHLPYLARIETTGSELTVGAAATFAQVEPYLLEHFPETEEWLHRFASVPIRNQATMGGNVANASPIGDSPPLLLALNAEVVVDDGTNTRQLPLADFFLGYRQTALKPGEWLDSIVIPLPKAGKKHLRAYKVSKRFEDDISAVCAVFNLELENGKIKQLSAGFGGVAATPMAAPALQSLVAQPWDKDIIEKGKSILSGLFTPIDDVRASAQYRQDMVVNLWQRFVLESLQPETILRVPAYA